MTLVRSIAASLILASLGFAATAQIDILSVTFSCEDNTEIPVSYFNATDGSGAAAMVIDGELIAMRQAESGSGVRYISEGAEGTYTLRSKGWDALISYQASGNTAPEQLLLGNCTSR
ncbi:MliC family protein [Ruegeria arenilitoris]|uniref:MliC family protein n=1 Tax=Ruegeria arenilitoris TaxID=1173585 RepID=UPI00147F1017|nr:MliC family protein [Ruegeria arenilitoris]